MSTIKAEVANSHGDHQVTLTTNNQAHTISIPPKAEGFGSSANGGELLFLALATCYCNDVYREAARQGIAVRSVRVEVSGEFGAAPGSTAERVAYRATVEAEASREQIIDLMRHTDTVAEIQNTLRLGIPVTLESVEAIPV